MKKCGFVEINKHNNILMIPNRLILYRQPLTSKHLPYIKVYAIDSGGYIDSGEENHSFTESLFQRSHGHHSLFSSKQNSLHMETLQIPLHPLLTTTLFHKGQKGKRSPQNKLPNTGMAKLSSPGTLHTPGRVTELEIRRDKVGKGCRAL